MPVWQEMSPELWSARSLHALFFSNELHYNKLITLIKPQTTRETTVPLTFLILRKGFGGFSPASISPHFEHDVT